MLGCKITIFNKRRGSEFIKATKREVKEAIVRREGPVISEFEDNLTLIEIALSEKMKLLIVKGKGGKGVPVLFEPEDYWNLSLKTPNARTTSIFSRVLVRGHTEATYYWKK